MNVIVDAEQLNQLEQTPYHKLLLVDAIIWLENQIKFVLNAEKKFSPKNKQKQGAIVINVNLKKTITGASTRKLIKQWALDYKGNKCKYCGYDKCIEALEFHHINPDEKDFSISDRNIKLDWEEIKKELDKCVLVCSNCHREIHAGYLEQQKEGSDD